ncbi:MAG: class I SAM-dependent methyltransferase [Pseudomonadota bacterium]
MAFLDKAASGLTKIFPRLRRDREAAHYMREHVQPIAPVIADEIPNKPVTMLNPPAIDFCTDAQLALLASLRSERHKALFRELREDPVINRFGLGSAGVSNTFCNTPDAEIYAAMIMDRKPPTLVEVGSGFSTLIARKAVSFAHSDTRIVVYDPYPRTDVKPAADELHLAPVEQSDLAGRHWAAGDLLFIDSSHICRTRGDLPYLFCNVIPSLPPGVLVHVHDIFLPYDYPNLYDQWCHTEQYLLACMLAHSRRYKVVLATHWLSRAHPAAMNEAFGALAGVPSSAPHHLGCSFWFEVVAG